MRDSDYQKALAILARLDAGEFDKELGRDPELRLVVDELRAGFTISQADVKLLAKHGLHDLVVMAHEQGRVAAADDLVGNVVRDAFPATSGHDDPHTIIQKASGTERLTVADVARLTRLGRVDLLEKAMAEGRIT
jgi:hypothetical protein